MVVLGSYGSDACAGMLAGSVAIGVLGDVSCPVAIVRFRESRVGPPRDGPVVVGVDGSPAGAAALTFAADLAMSIGSRLVAVLGSTSNALLEFAPCPVVVPRSDRQCAVTTTSTPSASL